MKAARCVTLIGLLATTVAGGCDESPTAPRSTREDIVITPLTTTSSSTVGTVVTPAPAFLVTQGNKPLANARLNFSVSAGDIIGADTSTGPDGIARAGSWKLASGAGRYELFATINHDGRFSSAKFTAIAVADKVARLAWTDSVNVTLDRALLTVNIAAYDKYANSVAGARIRLAVTRSDGTQLLDSAITDARGLAHFDWAVTEGVSTITATESSGISSTYTVKTVEPSVLLAGTYELESVQYQNFMDTTLKSIIVLKPDGLFTVDVRGITGGGKYIVTNDGIIFQYAGNFLNELFADLSWAPNSRVLPPSDIQGEHAVLRSGNLLFYRCLTEDCYDATWVYRPVR